MIISILISSHLDDMKPSSPSIVYPCGRAPLETLSFSEWGVYKFLRRCSIFLFSGYINLFWWLMSSFLLGSRHCPTHSISIGLMSTLCGVPTFLSHFFTSIWCAFIYKLYITRTFFYLSSSLISFFYIDRIFFYQVI